jgi:pimeloyl-ACP methyl ester carboxylesterase
VGSTSDALEEEPGRNVLAFDFLGFGLSAKPREHDYSLFWPPVQMSHALRGVLPA